MLTWMSLLGNIGVLDKLATTVKSVETPVNELSSTAEMMAWCSGL